MTLSPSPSIMVWIVLFSLAIGMLALPALSSSLSRDMASRVDPGASFDVRLNIPDAVSGESLTVEETLPNGVTLSSWSVSGVKESKEALQKDPSKYRVKGSAYAWSVTPTGPVTISYSAKAPSSQGILDFQAVWFDKSGFNQNKASLNVAPASAPSASPSPAPTTAPAPSPAVSPPPAQKPLSGQSPGSVEGSGTSMWIWIVVLLLIIVGVAWYYWSK